MTNTKIPATPLPIVTNVCDDVHSYTVPPMVIPNNNDVLEAVKIPIQSIRRILLVSGTQRDWRSRVCAIPAKQRTQIGALK
jgi:hypothetical protein